jgi:hypothetical protein
LSAIILSDPLCATARFAAQIWLYRKKGKLRGREGVAAMKVTKPWWRSLPRHLCACEWTTAIPQEYYPAGIFKGSGAKGNRMRQSQ